MLMRWLSGHSWVNGFAPYIYCAGDQHRPSPPNMAIAVSLADGFCWSDNRPSSAVIVVDNEFYGVVRRERRTLVRIKRMATRHPAFFDYPLDQTSSNVQKES